MCTIILYGRSLVLDALEGRLRQTQPGGVIRLTETLETAWLSAAPPGLLIYDHTHTDAATLHHLFQRGAGWAFLGLTDDGDLLVTHRQPGLMLDDVLALVQTEAATVNSQTQGKEVYD